MLKIGGFFRTVKTEKFQPKLVSDQTTTITNPVEQFIKSADYPSGIGEVISQTKDEVINPLDSYLKEHPDLEMFVPLLVAGGVAGWLDKKLEEKRELTNYLKSLEKFAKKVKRHLLGDKLSPAAYLGLVVAGVGLIGIGPCLREVFNSVLPAAASITAGFACSVGALLPWSRMTNLHPKEQFLSEDGRAYICNDSSRQKLVLAALPLSGDKLIFYDIKKDRKNRHKLEAQRIINLPYKATCFGLDKETEKGFSINYDNKEKLEFSIYNVGDSGCRPLRFRDDWVTLEGTQDSYDPALYHYKAGRKFE